MIAEIVGAIRRFNPISNEIVVDQAELTRNEHTLSQEYLGETRRSLRWKNIVGAISFIGTGSCLLFATNIVDSETLTRTYSSFGLYMNPAEMSHRALPFSIFMNLSSPVYIWRSANKLARLERLLGKEDF